MSTNLIEKSGGETSGVGTAMAASRQSQEVQAAMVVAKRFPRDEDTAAAKIVNACKRKLLAEAACYEYSKGGSKITGPSIRLAEVLAQYWGNIDFGWVELERRPGTEGVTESVVQAHAWDLETNVRRCQAFTVRHWRDTKQGGYKLTDERDIYELIANQAARRVRACVLSVIPGDIQDLAVEQCDKTLAGHSTEPIEDRIRKMLAAFRDYGVTKEMLEAKLGHTLAASSNGEMAKLQKIFISIRDGFAPAHEHFPPQDAQGDKPQSLGDLAKGKSKGTRQPVAPDAPPPPVSDEHPTLTEDEKAAAAFDREVPQ